MKQDRTYNLKSKDFAKLFGTSIADIPKVCQKIIKESDFRYNKLSAKEQAELMYRINKKIKDNDFFTAGKKARSIWQKRWSDQLKNFKAQNFQVEALIPEYFNKPNSDVYFRFYDGFIKPVDKRFEFNWLRVYRHWLFGKYLRGYNSIYDFGCGSGINTAILAHLFPKKKLHCLDWVASSKQIASLMAEKWHWNVSGHVFDMFDPDYGLKIGGKSAFITYTSLEQMGTQYRAFVEFAIKKKAALCISVDSFDELYSKTSALDQLAVKFAEKRNYLRHYLGYLRHLESEKKIKIMKIQRVRFGSIYQDNNSYIMWKPI